MKRIVMIAMILVLSMLSAQAEYLFSPNTQQTLTFGCLDEATGLHVASTANVTIYYPNTSVYLLDEVATNYSSGLFNYTFTTPTMTGVYPVEYNCFKVSDGSQAQASGFFQVKDIEEESGMALVGTILGIVAFIAIVLLIVFNLDPKEHLILRLASYLFLLFLAILLPKAVIDTLGLDSQVANSFLEAVTWFQYFFIVYVIVYVFYKLFTRYDIMTKVINFTKGR